MPTEPDDVTGHAQVDHEVAAGAELSETERDVLDLERSWWKFAGAKATTVHHRFGWTMTWYYQVLDALIDTPAALAHDPLTVNRLCRLRAERRKARESRG